MALSEIEKLERRYAENPQGLTFAPLAEGHRKNGDVARALELLRSGLSLHPDYIPASIVLGRCHLDLGDLPLAETAFAHVLALDGENVIALKAMADIAERQYRFDDAERWLHTLVAVDRSNHEAREQLSRVEVSRRQAGVASSASPDAAIAPDEAPPLTGDTPAGDEGATPAKPAGEPASAPAPGLSDHPEAATDTLLAWAEESGSAADEPAPLELQELELSQIDESIRPAGIEIEQPVTLEEPVEPLSGLVGRHDQEGGSDLHVSSEAWEVETAEDIVLESVGGGEFQVANASEELLFDPSVRHAEPSLPPAPAQEAAAVPAGVDPDAGGSTEQVSDESGVEQAASEPGTAETTAGSVGSKPDAVETAAPRLDAPAGPATAPAETAASAPGDTSRVAAWGESSWSPPVAEPPGRSEADLLVTESMAELLAQQGHTTEALTVYRHLEARTGDRRFRAKAAELERNAATTAAAPAAAAEPIEAPPSPPAYSVKQTRGQSVHAFLRGVLGARPQAAPPAPVQPGAQPAPDASTSGAPTRPAHDSLSLSSVFGDESTPSPPAVPAAGAGEGSGGVSYDEFFGTASSTPARPSRTPDAKSDDLDQFHAWLQNLKR